MLEPIWSRNYLACVQITMAESFGVEDRGHFYDPVGALRDVVVNHLMQVVAAAAMEPPSRGDPDTIKDDQVALFRSDRRPPTRRTTCAASTTATSTIDGVAPGLDHRDLRRAAARDRELALVGRPVLHPHRQAPAGHADRAAARLQAPAAAGLRGQGGTRPEPNQLVVKLDPSTGIRLIVDAHRADMDRRVASHARPRVRRAGRRGRRRPTRCCSTPRWSATAPASRARTASRSAGG